MEYPLRGPLNTGCNSLVSISEFPHFGKLQDSIFLLRACQAAELEEDAFEAEIGWACPHPSFLRILPVFVVISV